MYTTAEYQSICLYMHISYESGPILTLASEGYLEYSLWEYCL